MVTKIKAQGEGKGRKKEGEGGRNGRESEERKQKREEYRKKMTPLSLANLISEMGLKLNNGVSLLTMK